MAELNFEQAMKRLEQIVESLEEGNLTLEDSLKIFEEGVKLSRLCSRKLEEAEKKVEILLQGEADNKKLQPFELGQQVLFNNNDRKAPRQTEEN
jgi:exodeoxyribonuclease VII small subunit